MKILIDDKTRLLDSAVRNGELAELFTPGLSTGFALTDEDGPKTISVSGTQANCAVVAYSGGGDSQLAIIMSDFSFESYVLAQSDDITIRIISFPENAVAHISLLAGSTPINSRRLAFGMMRSLRTSNTREVGMYSTHQSRQTLSGQVIQGAGGYTGRKVDVDIRYKITDEIFADFEAAYPSQIGRGYPFFIDFSGEKARGTIPWDKLYATMDKPESFLVQSSARRPRYSKRIKFREAF